MARKRDISSVYLERELAIMGLFNRFGTAAGQHEYRYRGAKEINLDVKRERQNRRHWWAVWASEKEITKQSKSSTWPSDEDANEHGLLPIIHQST